MIARNFFTLILFFASSQLFASEQKKTCSNLVFILEYSKTFNTETKRFEKAHYYVHPSMIKKTSFKQNSFWVQNHNVLATGALVDPDTVTVHCNCDEENGALYKTMPLTKYMAKIETLTRTKKRNQNEYLVHSLDLSKAKLIDAALDPELVNTIVPHATTTIENTAIMQGLQKPRPSYLKSL